jgi:MerR family transcriptional regulator, copper efflux regulator
LSPKAIRDFEARALIYNAGRSGANYRLFDESALWCVRVIAHLRALGLTVKEIEEFAVVYLDRPVGPHLDAALRQAQRRIEERIADLEAIQRRIGEYRRHNAVALTGTGGSGFPVGDPRRPRPGA